MIIIDASLALDISVATPQGDALSDQLMGEGHALAAPEVIELEVLQALHRLLWLDRINLTTADRAMAVFAAMEIERYSHLPLRSRIWSLRDNLTAYDAAYFALAELLDAPLWTRDNKFSDIPGHQARVEIL